jgi:hypothetical protein
MLHPARRRPILALLCGVMLLAVPATLAAGARADSSPEKRVLPDLLKGNITITNQQAGFSSPSCGGAVQTTTPWTETVQLKNVEYQNDPTAKDPGLYKVVGGTGSVSGSSTSSVSGGTGCTNWSCTTTTTTAGSIKTPLNNFTAPAPVKSTSKVNYEPIVPATQTATGNLPGGCGPGESFNAGYNGAAPPSKLEVKIEKDGTQDATLTPPSGTQTNGAFSDSITGGLKGMTPVSFWGGFCATLTKSRGEDTLRPVSIRLFRSNLTDQALADDMKSKYASCAQGEGVLLDGLPLSAVSPARETSLGGHSGEQKIQSISGQISTTSMTVTSMRAQTTDGQGTRIVDVVLDRPFTFNIYQANNVKPNGAKVGNTIRALTSALALRW